MNRKVSPNEDDFAKAYDYAVFLLGIRLRTEGEIREKLKVKGYRPEVIGLIITELANQHYLDDQRFAEIFLENLKKYKYFGYYGIKKKMMEKKLPLSIIEQVLNEGLSEEEELRIAGRFVRNFKPPFAKASAGGLGIMNYEEKQKAASKLAARGFRTEVIRKTIF